MTTSSQNTWQENPADIIMLENKSSNNYILELPAGRYRLDKGRRMRTMRSILDVEQVKKLVEAGDLAVSATA
ncbi:MAG: hypothetical protein AAF702_32660 [Chloroflexota bacterium]